MVCAIVVLIHDTKRDLKYNIQINFEVIYSHQYPLMFLQPQGLP